MREKLPWLHDWYPLAQDGSKYIEIRKCLRFQFTLCRWGSHVSASIYYPYVCNFYVCLDWKSWESKNAQVCYVHSTLSGTIDNVATWRVGLKEGHMRDFHVSLKNTLRTNPRHTTSLKTPEPVKAILSLKLACLSITCKLVYSTGPLAHTLAHLISLYPTCWDTETTWEKPPEEKLTNNPGSWAILSSLCLTVPILDDLATKSDSDLKSRQPTTPILLVQHPSPQYHITSCWVSWAAWCWDMVSLYWATSWQRSVGPGVCKQITSTGVISPR